MKTKLKDLKAWMDVIVPKLREHLYLDGWLITVRYRGEDKKSGAAMDIHTDDKYMYATINVYPGFLATFDRQSREMSGLDVVHELVHIFTDPLYKFAINRACAPEDKFIEDIRERSTQMAALAIWRGLPTKFWLGEKKKRKVTR